MRAQPGAAVAAASSLLSTDADELVLVELAAWVLGAAGEPVPEPADPVRAAHARLAAAGGAGDLAEVERLLTELLPRDEGTALLASACELVGPVMADALVEVAHRHPDRRYVGRMLAGTTEPARLLALLPDGPAGPAAIETIGELVLLGRDRAQPVPEAEARWTELAEESPSHLSGYREVLLRITARESLESALSLLVALGEEWGRDRLVDGARAVLARLVRVAPERAAEVVGSASDPRDRVAWLEALAWWLDLSPSTVPLVQELLDHDDPDLDLAVARILTRTPELGLLDQSLRTISAHDPHVVARSLAPGVHQLRAGGHLAVAERVRRRCLDAVAPAAVSTFEVVASPGPELVPWAGTIGVP